MIRKRRSKTKKQGLVNEKWRELRDYDGPDQVISSRKMTQKLREKPQNLIKVKSLIPSLDEAVEGFQGGELIVVSGATKNGKTLFAQTLTANFAKQRHFSLWFPYEVPVRQFFSQFPSVPQFFLPQQLKPHSLAWVKKRVYECYAKNKTKIIFIDHLHYLLDLVRTKNLSLDIGTIIRQLKTMAARRGFIIFLLAHTTKTTSDKDLSYQSIRDSSFIAQESDCVLMIRRTPWHAENAAHLTVEFHRRTGVLKKKVNLIKFKGLLVERTSDRKKSRDSKKKGDEDLGDQ